MLDDLNENNDGFNNEINDETEVNEVNEVEELIYSTSSSEQLDEQIDDSSPSEQIEEQTEDNSTSDQIDEQVEDNSNFDDESVQQSSAKASENNSISADLIRGHINTIILRALYERDKYGYEIINDIESKSHGQYTLKQPTLYSALKRLENQGYIKAYWKTDEVTLGGRRKYFKLTDSGKAITEKNLSEWEYSRTIIDSLISDKSFDFAKPAPTPVDFSLLRDSVSRVPTVKVEEKPINDEIKPQTIETSAQTEVKQETPPPPVSTKNVPVQDVQTASVENKSTETKSLADESAAKAEEEAARKRTHENYLRLISEPVRNKSANIEDTVPGSDNINSDKLLYNNKPETERDYKNLIDGIFYKTIYNGSVQTTYHSKQSEHIQHRQSNSSTVKSNLVEKGARDGVIISPSNTQTSSRASKTTYNKGVTLLKSSAVVFSIMAIEAILCFIFMNKLAINWLYPSVILAIGAIQFAVFAILALNGYGKHSVLPTNHSYISTCIILTIISILIIAMLSFLLNMNTAVISDILTMLVIPAVTSLNITIFGISFKLFIS